MTFLLEQILLDYDNTLMVFIFIRFTDYNSVTWWLIESKKRIRWKVSIKSNPSAQGVKVLVVTATLEEKREVSGE